ncbi:MAG: DUF2339 domain-containing protein [Proteobacteria bacterium]|nr:DUF2339 domain-containing protein [Pseudomonadota bacterium]
MPAVAFLAAAYLFGGRRDDRLVLHLQGGAVALIVALQVVATRHLAAGGLLAPVELAEFAVHAAAWLAAALVFARSARGSGHPVLHGSAALLFLGALLCIAAGPLLFANPLLTNEPVGSWPILNLLAPAFALPAVLLALLAREQERQQASGFAALAWGAALGLALAYVTLDIRHAFHGSHMGLALPGAGETMVVSLTWLILAWLVGLAGRRLANRTMGAAANLLALAALLAIATGASIVFNPLLTDLGIGGWPLLNLLALGYGLPALVAAALAHSNEQAGNARLARIAWAAAGLLAFAWINLEIRHAFHGPYLDRGGIVDAELYAYSVGWLTIGLGLLAGGLVSGRAALRYASLALICAVAAKAFLWDMAGLTGVFRALTFLGLGAVLIGIGFLYQRFVFRRVETGGDGA